MAELSLHTFTLGDTPPHVSSVKARSLLIVNLIFSAEDDGNICNPTLLKFLRPVQAQILATHILAAHACSCAKPV